MPADPQLIDLLARAGAFTLLAAFIVALLSEAIYTRGRFKAMEKEMRFWRRVALKGKSVLTDLESELDGEPSE